MPRRIQITDPATPANRNAPSRLAAALTEMSDEMKSSTRRFHVGGAATSIRLENRMWRILDAISHRERRTLQELVHDVSLRRARGASLASALRGFILHYDHLRRLW